MTSPLTHKKILSSNPNYSTSNFMHSNLANILIVDPSEQSAKSHRRNYSNFEHMLSQKGVIPKVPDPISIETNKIKSRPFVTHFLPKTLSPRQKEFARLKHLQHQNSSLVNKSSKNNQTQKACSHDLYLNSLIDEAPKNDSPVNYTTSMILPQNSKLSNFNLSKINGNSFIFPKSSRKQSEQLELRKDNNNNKLFNNGSNCSGFENVNPSSPHSKEHSPANKNNSGEKSAALRNIRQQFQKKSRKNQEPRAKSFTRQRMSRQIELPEQNISNINIHPQYAEFTSHTTKEANKNDIVIKDNYIELPNIHVDGIVNKFNIDIRKNMLQREGKRRESEIRHMKLKKYFNQSQYPRELDFQPLFTVERRKARLKVLVDSQNKEGIKKLRLQKGKKPKNNLTSKGVISHKSKESISFIPKECTISTQTPVPEEDIPAQKNRNIKSYLAETHQSRTPCLKLKTIDEDSLLNSPCESRLLSPKYSPDTYAPSYHFNEHYFNTSEIIEYQNESPHNLYEHANFLSKRGSQSKETKSLKKLARDFSLERNRNDSVVSEYHNTSNGIDQDDQLTNHTSSFISQGSKEGFRIKKTQLFRGNSPRSNIQANRLQNLYYALKNVSPTVRSPKNYPSISSRRVEKNSIPHKKQFSVQLSGDNVNYKYNSHSKKTFKAAKVKFQNKTSRKKRPREKQILSDNSLSRISNNFKNDNTHHLKKELAKNGSLCDKWNPSPWGDEVENLNNDLSVTPNHEINNLS